MTTQDAGDAVAQEIRPHPGQVMDVHVHEARNGESAGDIDDLGAFGNTKLRADLLDPAVADKDYP